MSIEAVRELTCTVLSPGLWLIVTGISLVVCIGLWAVVRAVSKPVNGERTPPKWLGLLLLLSYYVTMASLIMTFMSGVFRRQLGY